MLVHFRHGEPYQRARAHALRARLMPTISKQTQKRLFVRWVKGTEMTKPICSVVIPTRDCLDYLKQSIPTIYQQKLDDVEIIIVDDGSTDGSHEYLAECQKTDKNFVVLQTDGIGPGRARNHAIEQANSDLIAFLDADDLWTEGKLGRQLAFHAAHPDASLSFTDYVHFRPGEPLSCLLYTSPSPRDRG